MLTDLVPLAAACALREAGIIINQIGLKIGGCEKGAERLIEEGGCSRWPKGRTSGLWDATNHRGTASF